MSGGAGFLPSTVLRLTYKPPVPSYPLPSNTSPSWCLSTWNHPNLYPSTHRSKLHFEEWFFRATLFKAMETSPFNGRNNHPPYTKYSHGKFQPWISRCCLSRKIMGWFSSNRLLSFLGGEVSPFWACRFFHHQVGFLRQSWNPKWWLLWLSNPPWWCKMLDFPFKFFVGLFGEGNNIQNIELINIWTS